MRRSVEAYIGVDQHFSLFHDLMQKKVRNVLLVSSPYDAFIMEEDGSISTRIINEFHGLNLSNPPKITWALSGKEALEKLVHKRFDLVITMPEVSDMDGSDLARQVKVMYGDMVIAMLSHSMANPKFTPEVHSCTLDIDRFFVWSTDPALLLAIIKNVEDHLNVESDTQNAMVRVIILVEDSPYYISKLLPLIYKKIVQQTQDILDESLNQEHRLLKMRARPKILLATSYEEAQHFYERYKKDVLGVISDGRYMRKCQMDSRAGLRLLSKIRKEQPSLPLLLLSADSENKEFAHEISARFIDKNSATLDREIQSFFLNNLGFGDFIFRLPDGQLAGRATNFKSFEEGLHTVPDECLVYHVKNHHFSTWVMARSEVVLASKIHMAESQRYADVKSLRECLIRDVHSLRKERQQGVVVHLSDGGEYDREIMDFVKIGHGSLGGKGRGLAFMANILPKCHTVAALPLRVKFPKTIVIASSGFDAFVEENSLQELDRGQSDETIAELFLSCPIPAWLLADLRKTLKHINVPLCVRSSSLLEDGHARPYAGLYKTYMIPNNQDEFQDRFAQLQDAIRLVWASTWFEAPMAFSKSLHSHQEHDSMAVVIQEVVGRQYGDYFYPAVSGVAQSHNFYPIEPMQSEDGIVHVALGLGKTVVEGEKSVRFSPKYPKHILQFATVDDMLSNGQRYFYCLDMTRTGGTLGGGGNENLAKLEVSECLDSPAVMSLASSYYPQEDRIRDGFNPHGVPILTFASILKYKSISLPESLSAVLTLAYKGIGCPAEIEFAVDLDPDPEKSILYILQMRPMVKSGDSYHVSISAEERGKSFCHSHQVLGHGVFDSIHDIIMVKPADFDPAKTVEIAAEINGLNKTLLQAGLPYLLVGPGRWGSADRWLGIPVQWQDISGVRGFIELRPEGFKMDPSQGTHFFQNITSLGIPYITMTENGDHWDYDFLLKQEVIAETTYLQHIRMQHTLMIKIDGAQPECVMYEELPRLDLPIIKDSSF
jgi:CheY-like chemotaxis protein